MKPHQAPLQERHTNINSLASGSRVPALCGSAHISSTASAAVRIKMQLY